jgi:multiple sugar transport system substrate-binding protein
VARPPNRPHRLAAVALTLAAAAALACSPGGGASETVVEFWAFGREGELVRALVPEFERAHPGLRVRVQQIPWSAAHEKLLTAWVGGALPDALQLGNTWLPEFAALGALDPLDARIAAAGDLPPDDWFAGLLEMARVDGVTHALPWYADTRLLFYRRDLLAAAGVAEPPRTWDAWRDALARLRAAMPADTDPLLLPLGEWEVPVILALQRDAELLRDGGRYGSFQSPAFREAFAFYLELFERGFAARRGAAQLANLHQEFAAGRFAMFVTGPWNLGELARRLPYELAESWGIAPMPAPEGDAPGLSLAGGASLALVAGSPRVDAAWTWIAWLSLPAQQAAFHALSGDLPARRSAWDDPALAADERARAFRIQLEHVRATPQVPEWERIASRIARHAESAVRGSATPDEALAALDRDADRVLEKRRWLLARGAAR